MKKGGKYKRKTNLNVKVTILVVSLFFLIIILKLSYVVLSPKVDGINLTEFASNRNTAKETLYASRGIIYDVDGKPLAKNTNSYKIIAILSPSRTTDMENPMHVVDKEQTATKICTVVASTDENKAKCQSDLVSYFSQNLYQVELGIWGKISEDERQALLKENLPGIIFETLAKEDNILIPLGHLIFLAMREVMMMAKLLGKWALKVTLMMS